MQQAPVVYVKIVLYSSVTPLSEGMMVMNDMVYIDHMKIADVPASPS